MANGKHHPRRYKQRHRPKHLVPGAAAMQARRQARDCAVAATGLVVVAASLAMATEPRSFTGVAQQRNVTALPLPAPRVESTPSESPHNAAASEGSGAGSADTAVSQVDDPQASASFAWAQLSDPGQLNRDLRASASAEPKHLQQASTSAEPSKRPDVRPSQTVSGGDAGPVAAGGDHGNQGDQGESHSSPTSSSEPSGASEPSATPTTREPHHEPAHAPGSSGSGGSGGSPTPAPSQTPPPPPAAGPTSSTTGCVPHPSSCGYPDASNTGAHGTLTPSGPIDSTTDGEVIANLAVSGHITVTSANVTIKNVRIVGDNSLAAIDAHGATGPVTIDHVTISYPTGVSPGANSAIRGGNGFTVSN
ncbi:MAG: hypothetical protein ACRDV3_11755, partial [Acidothermaceae bacterium]